MNDATIELAQVDETSSALNSPMGLSKGRWMGSGIEVVFTRSRHRRSPPPKPCAAHRLLSCVIGHILNFLDPPDPTLSAFRSTLQTLYSCLVGGEENR
jgi:hypothetical protein